MAFRARSERKKKPLSRTHTQRTNERFFFSEVGVRTGSTGRVWVLGKECWEMAFGSDGDDDCDKGMGGLKGALYFDLEGRTGDVVVAPFYQQDVVATFAHQVVDLVLVAAGVLDEHLVAGSLWSVNANE